MSARLPHVGRSAFVVAGLFLGTFLLYARSAGYGFLDYDDPRYILNNTAIQAGFTPVALRWAFTGHGDIWNPLVRLTHILDVELFGLNPLGHHLQGIFWHAVNAVLAFLLLRRLTGTFWTSALGAALFAWHPLRVESVTWISERKDVVSVAFGLLTVLAYLGYARRRAAAAPAGRWYALTLLACAAALLSKPSMVTLPGIFLLLDFWPTARLSLGGASATSGNRPARSPLASLLVEKLPFVLMAGILAYVTVHTQTAAGDFVLELPLGARLANAVVALPRYLGMFFWPFNLSTAYSHPGHWPWPIVTAAAMSVVALSVFAWRTRHTQPWFLVGWLWFVGALIPMIGLLQVGFQAIADRYTYFPMFGWGLALLWSSRHYLAGALPRGLLAGVGLLLVAGCAARTWHQQGYWRDPVTLNEQAVAATKDDPMAHAFLAFSYAAQGRTAEARATAAKALTFDPKNGIATLVLARAAAAEGDLATAGEAYRAYVSLHPEDAFRILEFGHFLLSSRRLAEAEEVFRLVPADAAEAPAAQLGLALAALERGDRAAAYAVLTAANAAHPTDAALLERLAILLHQDGRAEEAARRFAHALELAPSSPDLLLAHGTFLFVQGRTDDALAALARAVEVRPHDPVLRAEHAAMLARLGRKDEALAGYRAAMDQDRNYAPAALAAGQLCAETGDMARAEEFFRQAIARQPTLVAAQLSLAHLLEAARRTDETDELFRAAFTAAPQASQLHRVYAEMLAKRRQFEPALVHYAKAVELAPDDAEARAGYGYLLLYQGRRTEALEQWEAALRLRPALPGLSTRAERLRRELGRTSP